MVLKLIATAIATDTAQKFDGILTNVGAFSSGPAAEEPVNVHSE
jgi:hypothetical protein